MKRMKRASLAATETRATQTEFTFCQAVLIGWPRAVPQALSCTSACPLRPGDVHFAGVWNRTGANGSWLALATGPTLTSTPFSFTSAPSLTTALLPHPNRSLLSSPHSLCRFCCLLQHSPAPRETALLDPPILIPRARYICPHPHHTTVSAPLAEHHVPQHRFLRHSHHCAHWPNSL
jgi:hypothetical protein